MGTQRFQPQCELAFHFIADGVCRSCSSKYRFGGPIREWSAIERLHLVNVPTFIINGRNAVSQDFVVEPLFRLIPKVKWVTLERSSHCPHMDEEREKYMKLVADFLET